MSQTEIPLNGYICTPYLHDHSSIELKEEWSHSKNVGDMYFVTATFSPESKPYFSSSANHYLLAKFKDNNKMLKEIEKHKQEKTSFVFSMDEDLFERESVENMNFVSVYYLEYGESDEDIGEVHQLLVKEKKLERQG